MKKWSIKDSRFDILFIYLTHAYKLKFISVNTEIIMSKFLDNYSDEEFYKTGESNFFEDYFNFIKEQIKTLNKMRKNTIFESVLFEVLRKLYVIFFRHLNEMIKHPNFDLNIKYVKFWLEETGYVKKYLRNITVLIHNSYQFDHYVIDSCSRRVFILELLKEIKTNLISLLIQHIKPNIEDYFSKRKFSDFSFNDLIDTIQEREDDFGGKVHQKFHRKYLTRKANLILQMFIQKVLVSEKKGLSTEIIAFKDKFIEFAGNEEEGILDDQVIYVEKISEFFESQSSFKSEMCLSGVYNLLSPKLKKKELLTLIELKTYSDKANFKLDLIKAINHYFERNINLQKDIDFHKKSTRILRIFMNTVLFLVKVKRRKKIDETVITTGKKKRRKTTKPDRTSEFINPYIDLDTFYTKKPVKVNFQVLNKAFLKKHYKGLPISDM